VILRDCGFWEEALVLDDPGLLERCVSLVVSSAVLTAVEPAYPARWSGLPFSPPALWASSSFAPSRWIGIVGTRNPSPALARTARQVAAASVSLGYGVVSGGAVGVDTIALAAAVRAGGSALAVLPRGLSRARGMRGVAAISACPSEADFDTQRAMQRNAWIYSASDLCLVIGPRFRQGGTWHGAVAALRTRHDRVGVLDLGDDATRSLIHLGGTGFTIDGPAEDVLRRMLADAAERSLFPRVSEAGSAYLS